MLTELACPEWPVLARALWWERWHVSGAKTCRWCPGFYDHLRFTGQIPSRIGYHYDDWLEDMYQFKPPSILDLRDVATLGGVTLKMMDEVEKCGRWFMISQSGDNPTYCILGFTDKCFHHPFLAALHFWLKSKIDHLRYLQENDWSDKDSPHYLDLVAAFDLLESMTA